MRPKQLSIIAVLISFLAVSAAYAIAYAQVPQLSAQSFAPPYQHPAISSALTSYNLLSYSSGRYTVPSVLLSYSTVNVSHLYVNVTLFQKPVPNKVYILDVADECSQCSDLQQVINLTDQYLQTYDVIPNGTSAALVSQQDLGSLSPGSVLIVLSGVIPDYFITNSSGGQPVMTQLLDHGVSVIYVGRNFGNATLSGSILVPVSESQLPSYMIWTGGNETYTNNTFFFRTKTFSLSGGAEYGPLTYINYGNGTLIAFSDYLNSWQNASQAAQDLAKSIYLSFWVPSYTSGSTSVPLVGFSSATGSVGVAMTSLSSKYSNYSLVGQPQGYGRITLYNNQNMSAITKGSTYDTIEYTQLFSTNGSVLLPKSILPGTSLPVSITINTRSSTPVTVIPHLNIYTINMTLVRSTPLPEFTHSGNFSQIVQLGFSIPQGQYIAAVENFNNSQYAAALFNVSPISVTIQTSPSNSPTGTFFFLVTSQGTPLSGINYTISLNGQSQSSGVVNNGQIVYSVPSTLAAQTPLSFNVSMLLRNYYVVVAKPPTPPPPHIVINNDYIELAVVIIISLIIVTVVKAPNRDEFYIDIPAMIEQKKLPITIKAADLAGVFEKQNNYFRWRYMPLSVDEIRQAILSNIRFNNMSVNLTYSNVEVLLTEMLTHGYVVSADNLYAPKTWVTDSGHDIEYLATFRKLRGYFVSHAYQATDIDTNDKADMVVTIHNERVYIVIYSKTSKFQKVPIFPDAKTGIAFLNTDKLGEFDQYLHTSTAPETEELRMYISAGQVIIINADNPEETLT